MCFRKSCTMCVSLSVGLTVCLRGGNIVGQVSPTWQCSQKFIINLTLFLNFLYQFTKWKIPSVSKFLGLQQRLAGGRWGDEKAWSCKGGWNVYSWIRFSCWPRNLNSRFQQNDAEWEAELEGELNEYEVVKDSVEEDNPEWENQESKIAQSIHER